MNINDLTIGEAKQLVAMLNIECEAKPHFNQRYVGQYVIVRSRSEGVNAGVLLLADETGVILKDARRLWYHKPADKSESWFEGVANHGLSEDSETSPPVKEKSIREAKTHEQS